MKNYTKIILIVSGLILVCFLFLLPKRVVDSKGRVLSNTEEVENEHDEENHSHESSSEGLSKDDSLNLIRLKSQLQKESSLSTKTLLTDSIAEIFGKNYLIDSATYYYEQIVSISPSLGNYELAGSGFYSLYRLTRQDALSEKAVKYFSNILQKDSSRNDLLAKVGFIKAIDGKKPPMEGIALVKKALENDPINTEALLRFGELFQIRGSNEEALVQFEKAVDSDPEHLDARIYLVEALRASKKDDECITHLEKIKELNKGQDKFIKDYVDRSLKELL